MGQCVSMCVRVCENNKIGKRRREKEKKEKESKKKVKRRARKKKGFGRKDEKNE